MNTIQKLMLALLMLGIVPGGLLAMDEDEAKPQPVLLYDATDDDLFEDAPEEIPGPVPVIVTVPVIAGEAGPKIEVPAIIEDTRNWQMVPYVGDPTPAVVTPPVAVVPPVVPVDNTVLVPPVQPAVVPVVNPEPVIYLDQFGKIHDVVEPSVPVTQVLLEKFQPLMTQKGFLGLTGLVAGILGLRYLYVSSVIKQMADLHTLRANCDSVLEAVLQGEADPDLVEVAPITCVGLNQELQDKLEDAVAGLNIAFQQLCHELCAQDGQMTDNRQEQQARRAIAVCQQVIMECEQTLVKNPTVMDTVVKRGSLWARALTTQVKNTATTLARRFTPGRQKSLK